MSQHSDLEEAFLNWWHILAPAGLPEPERELKLIPGRKFRCDFVWRLGGSGVVVEVDGGQYAAMGGRHNSDADREKINLLTLHGWRVLRYSGSMIENDPHTMISQVASALLNLKTERIAAAAKAS